MYWTFLRSFISNGLASHWER